MSPHPTSTLLDDRQRNDARVNAQTLAEAEIPNEQAKPQRKLNTEDAAAYAGLARSTLEKLRVFGGGPNYIKIGRRVVYDVPDLERWLMAHRRQSTSDVAHSASS
jgi:hypothetical protein